MNPESFTNGMNGLMDLWITESKAQTPSAPWEGDWRLAIAEERVAMARAKLAAAEQRVKELMESTSR